MPTTVEEGNGLILYVKASKGAGPSILWTRTMKQLNDIIASPLIELVNKSFQSGIFPDIFIIAKVTPIFKREARVLWNNKRPIYLLLNISKIIEQLIFKQLYSFLEQQNFFYHAQLGFRLSLSTNYALMLITKNIQSQLDQNKFCVVFVDLKKAFYIVDHEISLKKLSHYGFRGIENEQICSYSTKKSNMLLLEIHYQL